MANISFKCGFHVNLDAAPRNTEEQKCNGACHVFKTSLLRMLLDQILRFVNKDLLFWFKDLLLTEHLFVKLDWFFQSMGIQWERRRKCGFLNVVLTIEKFPKMDGKKIQLLYYHSSENLCRFFFELMFMSDSNYWTYQQNGNRQLLLEKAPS